MPSVAAAAAVAGGSASAAVLDRHWDHTPVPEHGSELAPLEAFAGTTALTLRRGHRLAVATAARERPVPVELPPPLELARHEALVRAACTTAEE